MEKILWDVKDPLTPSGLNEICVLAGQMGAQHFVLHEEEEAFADWMNRALSKDKDVHHHLPLAVYIFQLNFYAVGISYIVLLLLRLEYLKL